MNTQKLFEYSHYSQASENEKTFLPYKYTFIGVKFTFYENLKYLDDKKLLLSVNSTYYNNIGDYKFYDYVPFDKHDQ